MSRLFVSPSSVFHDAKVKLVMHEEGDAETLASFLANYDVAKLLARHEPKYLSEEHAYLAELPARKATNRAFGIWHVAEERIIGACGLHEINSVHRRATLGILIGEPTLFGKGYGTETVEQLAHHAFLSLNLHLVTLSVLGVNARAKRCYEKCGFQVRGRIPEAIAWDGGYTDEILMSLHKAEWLKRRNTTTAPCLSL
jgi:RimJ/RimL family protein N-acetyltransferase